MSNGTTGTDKNMELPPHIKALLGESNIDALLASIPDDTLATIKNKIDARVTPNERVTDTDVRVAAPIDPLPPAPAPVEQAIDRSRPPADHFRLIQPDFLLYDPNVSDSAAILGIPLDVIELPKQTSAGRALVIRLLDSTPCVDNSGRIVEAKPGMDILLEVSHWLRRLVRAAMDKDNVAEVWLRPTHKMPCDGGDWIWFWEMYGGKAFPREKFKR